MGGASGDGVWLDPREWGPPHLGHGCGRGPRKLWDERGGAPGVGGAWPQGVGGGAEARDGSWWAGRQGMGGASGGRTPPVSCLEHVVGRLWAWPRDTERRGSRKSRLWAWPQGMARLAGRGSGNGRPVGGTSGFHFLFVGVVMSCGRGPRRGGKGSVGSWAGLGVGGRGFSLGRILRQAGLPPVPCGERSGPIGGIPAGPGSSRGWEAPRGGSGLHALRDRPSDSRPQTPRPSRT